MHDYCVKPLCLWLSFFIIKQFRQQKNINWPGSNETPFGKLCAAITLKSNGKLFSVKLAFVHCSLQATNATKGWFILKTHPSDEEILHLERDYRTNNSAVDLTNSSLRAIRITYKLQAILTTIGDSIGRREMALCNYCLLFKTFYSLSICNVKQTLVAAKRMNIAVRWN